MCLALIIVTIIKLVFAMSHGGKRSGAGRPRGSYQYGEPTKVVRLPLSLVEQLPDLLSRNLSRRSPDQQETQVCEIYRPDCLRRYQIPLYEAPVSAGFPSPAEDYLEGKLDLDRHLIKHPAATFFVRVSGDSMIDAGIHPGDLLVVDRALEPTDGRVVIAVVNGELTVKRICRANDQLFLMPENKNYQPLQVHEETSFMIWGVVTNVIHSL